MGRAMTFAVAASGGLGGTIESAGGGHAKRAALRAGFQHTCRPHECCNANSACLQVCCLMFGGFGAGRDAEGAREAILGGFWAGRDAEGAREAILGGFWDGL